MEKLIRQFNSIPGAVIDDSNNSVMMPLSSDQREADGSIFCMQISGEMLFYLIDIRSTEIPDAITHAGMDSNCRILKINYCAQGRCELRLHNGECTYLAAGEISVDAGQASNTFYYPTGEYKGFEIVLLMGESDNGLQIMGRDYPVPEILFDACKQSDHPWIGNADQWIKSFYNVFLHYVDEDYGCELISVKCLELLFLLTKMDLTGSLKRIYCTAAQVEIAKKVKEILCRDLASRISARELAARFGISETSLKNYFRRVYGTGYAEYQHRLRMHKSAGLLRDTDEKIASIGMAVGFSSQAKFGAAFKEFYGVTPMEYRRQARLQMV